jgi:hypothetical protein
LKTLLATFVTIALMSATEAGDRPPVPSLVTLWNVAFVSEKVEVRFRVSTAVLASQPIWNPQDGKPPLDPQTAWSIAHREFTRQLPDQELVPSDISLHNARYYPDIRNTALAAERLWFYVIEAKPPGYHNGKRLSHPELFLVVILLDGRIVQPELSPEPPKA